MRPDAVRKSDGAFFEASYPDDFGEMISDMVADRDGTGGFYFREVKLQPWRWWLPVLAWKRTGVIWKPKSGEFSVL
jgi:hypothetical protein